MTPYGVIKSGQWSNNIFILNLTPGFIELDKDNCKTRRETFKFWDWVWLILEVLQYPKVAWQHQVITWTNIDGSSVTSCHIYLMAILQSCLRYLSLMCVWKLLIKDYSHISKEPIR